MDDEGNRRDRRRVLPVLLAVAAFAATPSLALDYRVRLYGAEAYVEPTANEVPPYAFGAPKKIEPAWAYELGLELKFAELAGMEVAYTDTKHDVQTEINSLGLNGMGTIDFRLIHVSLNVHVVRTKTLSWWLGPTLSHASSGELHFNTPVVGSVPLDDSWGFGLSTGVIVSVVKPLAFQAGVRWIKLDLTEARGGCGEGGCGPGPSFDVNPLIVHVGLALRFGSSVAPVPQEKRTDTQD